jgi:prevent-host-death family protein
MQTSDKRDSITVSVLKARTNFGKLIDLVDTERRSLVIEKRGTPRAVLMSIQDYVKLAAPEPEILRIIGEEAERSGANKLTSRQIDNLIKATRADRKKKH